MAETFALGTHLLHKIILRHNCLALHLLIEDKLISDLANLIDLAVKAGGIRVAADAAVLMQKLEAAAKAEAQKDEE